MFKQTLYILQNPFRKAFSGLNFCIFGGMLYFYGRKMFKTMKKVLLLSFTALALFAGCKKANTGGNGGGGEQGDVYVPATAATLNVNAELEMTHEETIQITVNLTPVNATPTIEWESSDPSIFFISDVSDDKATATVYGNMAGSAYVICKVSNDEGEPLKPSTHIRVFPKGVDMGDGTIWATANFGAISENETGYYIAWGETQQKTNYSLATTDESQIYKWWNGSNWTKYQSAGQPTLEGTDDAVLVNLGTSLKRWQTPTVLDFNNLINHSNITDAGGGKLKFTSIVQGYEGNSIVLPKCGIVEGPITVKRSVFAYWANSLSTNPDNANALLTDSNYNPELGTWKRNCGMAIRPVLHK